MILQTKVQARLHGLVSCRDTVWTKMDIMRRTGSDYCPVQIGACIDARRDGAPNFTLAPGNCAARISVRCEQTHSMIGTWRANE